MSLEEYKETCNVTHEGITMIISDGKNNVSRKMYYNPLMTEEETIKGMYYTLHFKRFGKHPV